MDIRKEMMKNEGITNDVKTEDVIARNSLTIDIPSERQFVKFRFSSQEAFSRLEAVRETQDILKRAIDNTGGNMPTKLIDTYEGLYSVMEQIKDLELEVIKLGR